jgi:vitamin B12 transporter
MRTFIRYILAAAFAVPGALAAQSDPPPLTACITAADKKEFGPADRIANEQLAVINDALRRAGDVELLVLAARYISQCQIPGAEMIKQGELSRQVVDHLTIALERDPAHWLARYILSMQYYRAPAFMGRAPLAAKELDRLLVQQGARQTPEIFARTFEYRGMLWMRENKADSALAVWTRGIELFPQDTALTARIQSARARLIKTESAPVRETPAAPLAMQTVVVTASRPVVTVAPVAQKVVERMDVLMAPGATGDVLQALQLRGGATLVGDGAELHARAGDPSETPLMLNGARVIGAVRFESLSGALFGALDPQILRSTTFTPGGFSARIGDALSGVIEAETIRRPRTKQSRIGLSSVSASATMQQPVGSRAGAWLSTRLSHTGPMLWMNNRSGEYPRVPRSADAVGGLVFEPNALTEIQAVVMTSYDDVARNVARADVNGLYRASGMSGTAALHVRHVDAKDPIVWRASLSASGRNSLQSLGILDRTRNDGIASFSGEIESQLSTSVKMRGGTIVSLLARNEKGFVPASGSLAEGAPTRALDADVQTASHVGVWAESSVPWRGFSITGGLRVDRLPKSENVTIDPRFNVSTVRGSVRLQGSVGQFHQGPWRANSAAPGPAVLLDVPTSATHYTFGSEAISGSWSATLFSKNYSGFVARGGPAIDRATVKGAEVIVRRSALGSRAVDGWISYSATKSRARLQDKSEVPGTYDVTHALVGVATWRVTSSTRIGVTTRLATGAPFTDVTGSDSSATGLQLRYGGINAARLPAYARTDVRVMHMVPTGSGVATIFLEAINVLDRLNITGWSYDSKGETRKGLDQFFARRTMVFGVELTR